MLNPGGINPTLNVSIVKHRRWRIVSQFVSNSNLLWWLGYEFSSLKHHHKSPWKTSNGIHSPRHDHLAKHKQAGHSTALSDAGAKDCRGRLSAVSASPLLTHGVIANDVLHESQQNSAKSWIIEATDDTSTEVRQNPPQPPSAHSQVRELLVTGVSPIPSTARHAWASWCRIRNSRCMHETNTMV